MEGLAGKVALITGVSNKRGFGRAIALRLSAEGADVAVTNRKKDVADLKPWDRAEGWRGLDNVAAEIEALGRRALAVTADVTDSREVNEMVEAVWREFGRIDVLVNNAGMIGQESGRVPVVDLDEVAWTQTISVNLTGVFLVSKMVATRMIEHGSGGKIVNISSMGGRMATPGRAAYCASKFGLQGLTRSMALELAPHKICVNALCPGAMGTAYYSNHDLIRQIPLGRPGTAADVANVVAFLASSDSDFMTGQAINVSGGRLMAH
jgi:NAD(P)-dependent dehydrogenase (short-subunit alcohol dehydrogenase family)